MEEVLDGEWCVRTGGGGGGGRGRDRHLGAGAACGRYVQEVGGVG